MTESSKVITAPNVVPVEKVILGSQNKPIGKILLGYKTDRVRESFLSAFWLGIVCLGLTQLFLSAAVFIVSRSIIMPIHNSLGLLSHTTSVLSATSNDFSKFSETLSSGVNEQAEVVQQTTAAMSEMTSMLTQTSQYAKQSETIMTSMTLKTNNGMNIMNQMVDAMTSVQQANEQLKQMVDIIQEITNKTIVINDIVFKTQLLSFNASIEAARAGQHGRGFAVVAEEVGNLAKMSGTAAQEIAALLQASERQVTDIVKNTYERVSTGQNVTLQALKNFKEIASDIAMISQQIANISAAAREQELGVAQTSQAMTELSKTTELNNQIAHRSADTSRILRTEISSLNSIYQAIEGSITGQSSVSANEFAFANEHHMAPPMPAVEVPKPVLSQAPRANYSPVELTDKILEMALKQRRTSDSDPNGDNEKKTRHG